MARVFVALAALAVFAAVAVCAAPAENSANVGSRRTLEQSAEDVRARIDRMRAEAGGMRAAGMSGAVPPRGGAPAPAWGVYVYVRVFVGICVWGIYRGS